MDFHHLIVKILEYSFVIIWITTLVFLSKEKREKYKKNLSEFKEKYPKWYKVYEIAIICFWTVFLASLLIFIFPYVFLHQSFDSHLLIKRIKAGVITIFLLSIFALIVHKRRNKAILENLEEEMLELEKTDNKNGKIMFYLMFITFVVFGLFVMFPKLVYLIDEAINLYPSF